MADNAQDPSLPQKKRARRRVVGAAVLCLGLAVGLPFVFDAEPKKNNKAVEQIPMNVSVAKPSTPVGGVAPSPVMIEKAPPDEPEVPKLTPVDPKTEAKVESKPEVKSEIKPEIKSEIKPEAKVPLKPPTPSTVTELIAQGDKKKQEKLDKQKADAASAASAPKGRYLVQIGAFGSSAGADEQSKRAAALGLKAFTEEISTNAGKRIRVRVGPFASKVEADKARETLKASGIDSALIAP